VPSFLYSHLVSDAEIECETNMVEIANKKYFIKLFPENTSSFLFISTICQITTLKSSKMDSTNLQLVEAVLQA
jgi:hypothetical protein